MTDRPPTDGRLNALEMRIAHQDAVIEDLNSALTAQWARIDALLRRFAQVEDRLSEAEARDGSAGLQKPPPHY